MKIKFLSTLAVAALLFSACNKDQTANEINDGAIQFNGKITNLKANAGNLTAGSSWAANDAIGVFMLQLDTSLIAENASNRKYVFNGSVFLPEAGQEIYYPVSLTPVDFISYAPYKAGIVIPGDYAVNLIDQSNQNAIDLLWAKSDNSGAGFLKTSGVSVPLTFDHKLSKIVIKTTAGSGLSASDSSWINMGVSINNLNTRANFDVFTGILSNPNTLATISPKNVSAGRTYEAIVLPSNNVAAGAFTFTFLIDGDTYTYRSTGGEGFQAGKEYTYNLSITKTGVNLGSITVTDWVSENRSGIAN